MAALQPLDFLLISYIITLFGEMKSGKSFCTGKNNCGGGETLVKLHIHILFNSTIGKKYYLKKRQTKVNCMEINSVKK